MGSDNITLPWQFISNYTITGGPPVVRSSEWVDAGKIDVVSNRKYLRKKIKELRRNKRNTLNYYDAEIERLKKRLKKIISQSVTSMSREEKLETIVKLFAETMFYGDWKWETPNERIITMLMKEVGMYPFKTEDEMIEKTSVSEELYQRASKEISTRQSKGDRSVDKIK